MSEGFQEALNWVAMMPEDESLSDSCTPDHCSFSSLVGGMFVAGQYNHEEELLPTFLC